MKGSKCDKYSLIPTQGQTQDQAVSKMGRESKQAYRGKHKFNAGTLCLRNIQDELAKWFPLLIAMSTIRRHGNEEWKPAAMTYLYGVLELRLSLGTETQTLIPKQLTEG